MARTGDGRQRTERTSGSPGARPPELLVVVEPEADPAGRGMLALSHEVARISGALAAGVHCVTWPADPPADVGAVADALAGLVRTSLPTTVLFLDTDLSRQLAPMVAYRCGGGAVVSCSDVVVRRSSEDEEPRARLTFAKPVYGGWLQRDMTPAPDAVPVVTLDLAGFKAPESSAPDVLTEPETLDLKTVAGPRSVRHLRTDPPDARVADLIHARRIVTAGAGATRDDLLTAVRELADLLEGGVGATRPVTDEGRLPKERLIGQTGRSVTPDLYVALGVSGSPHHVAGVQDAERVISVNRDARAPIFQFSDVGYVADLEEVLPALVRRIREWRDESTDA